MTNNGIVKFSEIVDAFENAGSSVQSYSGRGMYGKVCLGVSCDNAITTLLEAISGFVENCGSDQDEMDKVFEFVQLLKNPKTDSLGRGQILYFPNIKWEENDESGDEMDGDENVQD